MSSLIRPVPLQSCQTTLRGRRRSSVLALKSVPRLFSAKASTSTHESAVCDEPAPLDISPRSSTPEPSQIPPPIALPSDAHVSDYATSTVVGRYDNSKTIYSLALSPPETVVNSASSSPRSSPGSSTTDVTDDSPEKLEWLKFRLSSAFFVYFLCGWGDGVTGTVLPYFTTAYHLNPMTSSLLFTGSTCGVLHAMFFVMVGREGGYAVTFIAYAVAALARSFITATLNAYFVSGPPQSSLGYAYGLWSIGGVISPIVCQAIIARGVPWPHFYFGSLVLSGINCILLYLAFKPTNRETMGEWHEAVAETTKVLASPTYPTDEKHQHDAPPSSRSHSESESERASLVEN
ncbi:hypothetical protein C0991_010846 [Blastosporella zonata]|nr:hypothetical protein C0991_010846 [Blastosporella zonata]